MPALRFHRSAWQFMNIIGDSDLVSNSSSFSPFYLSLFVRHDLDRATAHWAHSRPGECEIGENCYRTCLASGSRERERILIELPFGQHADSISVCWASRLATGTAWGIWIALWCFPFGKLCSCEIEKIENLQYSHRAWTNTTDKIHTDAATVGCGAFVSVRTCLVCLICVLWC